MSRFHNALSANAFDFSTNVFSEKAFENAFGANANAFSGALNANATFNANALNASTATFNANSSTFNALSMMNMHTLVC